VNLAECRFTHAGQDVGFTVFADNPVMAKLDDVVTMELIGQAEIYRLEPSQKTQWVSVLENSQGKLLSRAWTRLKGDFFEVLEPRELARIRAAVEMLKAYGNSCLEKQNRGNRRGRSRTTPVQTGL